jgi:hypothetical protein
VTVTGANSHWPLEGLQVAPGAHVTGVPAQTPALQTSFEVQARPSLQEFELLVWMHAPLTHVSVVQGLPSSQAASPVH